MNHCRRCDSDYEKPGTCNCYASQAGPLAPPFSWYPTFLYPCPVCGVHGCKTTHVTWSSSAATDRAVRAWVTGNTS